MKMIKTNTLRTIRIAVATALVLALALTGIYVPAVQSDTPSGSVTAVAYADTPTGGAITGPAVTAPVNISAAVVRPIIDKVYTGEKIKPTPKVMLNGKKLKLNRDYKLSYKNNKLPGTATLTIKAKGKKYTGTKQIKFKIIIKKPVGFKLKVDSDHVTASWKKTSTKITGYKVYSAENASFTKSKKVQMLESAKAAGYSIDRFYYSRNYYVKVRAYKTIGKKNYYSEYTTVKSKKPKAAGWYTKISDRIGSDTKWIEVDLSKQIVYLNRGKKTVAKRFAVSTGKPGTATPKGTTRIINKIALHDMVGDINPATGKPEYVAKNVPWSTYFRSGGFAFHGASWNPQCNIPVDQPRIPKSHGCVNMRVKDAKYLYFNWSPIGTLTSVHK
jgi:lipoprotein-anchoring transpeptidase ErfK/SrfK